jgi:hypothetical protein
MAVVGRPHELAEDPAPPDRNRERLVGRVQFSGNFRTDQRRLTIILRWAAVNQIQVRIEGDAVPDGTATAVDPPLAG